jgi:glycosyltransferase involved in cell wall biosynthesis
MVGNRRAIVFGIHSFLDSGVKVSSQYVAEGLARCGWKVDYISYPSSPFDCYGHRRRKRLKRVWLQRQDIRGIELEPNLTEYAFRTLYPANRRFLRNRRMMRYFPSLVPAWLGMRVYDVCINDITANTLFLPFVRANYSVLRLNDSPEGFTIGLHPILIDYLKGLISASAYHDIWAVSEPLARYAKGLNPHANVVVLPNGIEKKQFYSGIDAVVRRPKTAVYLGSIAEWVDIELIEKTAHLMPDWKFHLFGTCDRSRCGRAPNLFRFPPVSRARVPQLLSGYEVGLIPFKETPHLTEHIERPLKYYEYIACGLGVASTDVGSLRAGMGPVAAYGNNPFDYAIAIERAAMERTKRPPDFCQAFVEKHAWENIISQMSARLLTLQEGQKN